MTPSKCHQADREQGGDDQRDLAVQERACPSNSRSIRPARSSTRSGGIVIVGKKPAIIHCHQEDIHSWSDHPAA